MAANYKHILVFGGRASCALSLNHIDQVCLYSVDNYIFLINLFI